jgi:hypothetical protein
MLRQVSHEISWLAQAQLVEHDLTNPSLPAQEVKRSKCDTARFVNLANLPESERQVIAIDNQVCFWLMLFRNGRITQVQINQALARLETEQQALYRDRLNHWRPQFKSQKSIKEYSEKQWDKLLALFNKTTIGEAKA